MLTSFYRYWETHVQLMWSPGTVPPLCSSPQKLVMSSRSTSYGALYVEADIGDLLALPRNTVSYVLVPYMQLLALLVAAGRDRGPLQGRFLRRVWHRRLPGDQGNHGISDLHLLHAAARVPCGGRRGSRTASRPLSPPPKAQLQPTVKHPANTMKTLTLPPLTTDRLDVASSFAVWNYPAAENQLPTFFETSGRLPEPRPPQLRLRLRSRAGSATEPPSIPAITQMEPSSFTGSHRRQGLRGCLEARELFQRRQRIDTDKEQRDRPYNDRRLIATSGIV